MQLFFTEATYAYKLKKKLIPVLVEKDYVADGWLGIVLGMTIYYKCVSDDQNEIEKNLIPKLVNAIKESGEDVEDGISTRKYFHICLGLLITFVVSI